MRIFTATAFVAALASTLPVQAMADATEMCSHVETLGREIMSARQRGMPEYAVSDVVTRASEGSPQMVVDLGDIMVRQAFLRPIVSDYEKSSVIYDYGLETRLACKAAFE